MRDPDKMPAHEDWLPDFPGSVDLDTVRTEHELLHVMRRCTGKFGFSHFLIARLPENELQRFSERLTVSNWPAELVRRYDALGLFHESRLVADASVTKRPVYGDGRLFACAADDDPRNGEAAALFESLGLEASLAFLLHSTQGEPYILVFSGRREPLARPDLAELYFISVQLFECLEKAFTLGLEPREKLSGREAECLRWAAAGKSSEEIAIILGISVYTVSSYFKSAARKLQAVNRMQAIACALRLKLI
ncbi:MAG: LuxR C-terminal-related transcriptional regulator [Shinella sp.]|nr:LuxR C-terminal-related transcriptional regulator [Shinella sp.]